MELDLIFCETKTVAIEVIPFHAPEFVPFHGIVIGAEEFHFHLGEFAGTECEHTGCDLVTECFPDLGDPEGELLTGRDTDQIEVQEDGLTAFCTQISDMFFIQHGTHIGFHHQIEFPGRGQVSGTAV